MTPPSSADAGRRRRRLSATTAATAAANWTRSSEVRLTSSGAAAQRSDREEESGSGGRSSQRDTYTHDGGEPPTQRRRRAAVPDSRPVPHRARRRDAPQAHVRLERHPHVQVLVAQLPPALPHAGVPAGAVALLMAVAFIHSLARSLAHACCSMSITQSANFYFLIIAILQSIPIISPLTPFTAIAPLVIVISISLLREAFEDQVRTCVKLFCATRCGVPTLLRVLRTMFIQKKRVSDAQINRQPVVVVRNFEEQCIPWEEIEVGVISLLPSVARVQRATNDAWLGRSGTSYVYPSAGSSQRTASFSRAARKMVRTCNRHQIVRSAALLTSALIIPSHRHLLHRHEQPRRRSKSQVPRGAARDAWLHVCAG